VAQPATPWLVAEHHDGAAAVQAAYMQVLSGRSNPRIGHVLSLSR
jgi:hypothetical protein